MLQPKPVSASYEVQTIFPCHLSKVGTRGRSCMVTQPPLPSTCTMKSIAAGDLNLDMPDIPAMIQSSFWESCQAFPCPWLVIGQNHAKGGVLCHLSLCSCTSRPLLILEAQEQEQWILGLGELRICRMRRRERKSQM